MMNVRALKKETMRKQKSVALVAHDNRKADLVEWVEWNYLSLIKHRIVCTGTTGKLVDNAIANKLRQDGDSASTYSIARLKSGPLGGDQQLGAMITEGEIDFVIFFWDPMEPQPHDVDVKALLRIGVLYNIPFACNRSSADFIISSPLMNEHYVPVVKDYSMYLQRELK